MCFSQSLFWGLNPERWPLNQVRSELLNLLLQGPLGWVLLEFLDSVVGRVLPCSRFLPVVDLMDVRQKRVWPLRSRMMENISTGDVSLAFEEEETGYVHETIGGRNRWTGFYVQTSCMRFWFCRTSLPVFRDQMWRKNKAGFSNQTQHLTLIP